MPVIAKFRVQARREEDHGQPDTFLSVELAPIMAIAGEDSIFGKYSPSGKASIGGLGPCVWSELKPGMKYYVDFRWEGEPEVSGAFACMSCKVTETRHTSHNRDTVVIQLWDKSAPSLTEGLFAVEYPNASFELGIENKPASDQFKAGDLVRVYLSNAN